ncbi:hypothetical protein EPYR_00612 [Erwinia pyrifoliae DSM 12163]|nr:hypothetical protein EPYR_00612 [Erwinia pyrifoliae DSM 12163]
MVIRHFFCATPFMINRVTGIILCYALQNTFRDRA